MKINYDLIRKNNEFKLQDLESELDEIKIKLKDYRMAFLNEKIGDFLYKKIGDKSREYYRNIEAEKYYNDELEVFYTERDNNEYNLSGLNIDETELNEFKDELVSYYTQDQVSINVFETEYCNDLEFINGEKKFHRDTLDEINSFLSSNEKDKINNNNGFFENYEKSIKSTAAIISEFTGNHGETYEIENLLKRYVENGFSEETLKLGIKSHSEFPNVSLHPKIDTAIGVLSSIRKFVYPTIVENTGRIVGIYKNTSKMNGDKMEDLISLAYIKEDQYISENNYEKAMQEFLMETVTAKTVGKLLGLATPKVTDEMLDIGRRIVENGAIDGINKMTRKKFNEVFSNQSMKLKKEIENLISEANKNEGVSSSTIDKLNNASNVLGFVSTIALNRSSN